MEEQEAPLTLDDLPLALLVLIVANLDVKSRLCVLAVNRTCRSAAREPRAWSHISWTNLNGPTQKPLHQVLSLSFDRFLGSMCERLELRGYTAINGNEIPALFGVLNAFKPYPVLSSIYFEANLLEPATLLKLLLADTLPRTAMLTISCVFVSFAGAAEAQWKSLVMSQGHRIRAEELVISPFGLDHTDDDLGAVSAVLLTTQALKPKKLAIRSSFTAALSVLNSYDGANLSAFRLDAFALTVELGAPAVARRAFLDLIAVRFPNLESIELNLRSVWNVISGDSLLGSLSSPLKPLRYLATLQVGFPSCRDHANDHCAVHSSMFGPAVVSIVVTCNNCPWRAEFLKAK